MPRKAKHLTVGDLIIIANSGILPTIAERVDQVFGQLTAIRLRSWARSEIARRAKAGAGRKVEGK